MNLNTLRGWWHCKVRVGLGVITSVVGAWRVQLYWPHILVGQGHIWASADIKVRVVWQKRHKQYGFGFQFLGLGFGVDYDSRH